MIAAVDLLRMYAILSYFYFVLAVMLNTIVFILVRKADKLDSFRYVFFTYCATDVFFALAHAISLAYWAHLPHAIVFFPTGPLADVPILTPLTFQLKSTSYVFVMCLVCSTFLHRLRLVSRQHSTFASKLRAKVVDFLVFIPVLQWLFCCAILMEPTQQLRNEASNVFGEKYQLDFSTIYLVGVDVNNLSEVDPLLTFTSLSILFEMSSMAVVVVWCGREIHRTIQSSIKSERSRQRQRQVLKMLIFQAVHPFLLLYTPSIINFAQLGSGFSLSEKVNLMLALSIAVYPVTNPLLILLLSKEISAPLSSFKITIQRTRKLGSQSATNFIPTSMSPHGHDFTVKI